MSDSQEFRILGTVALCLAGTEVPIPTRRARTVLACLCLEDENIVGVDTLVAALYPEEVPRSARNQVHRGVLELRRLGVSIESIGHSYRLDSSAHNLDSLYFERLTREAEGAAAARDLILAARLYENTLSLPRGPVLDGLDGPYFTPFQHFWSERIMSAEEGRARTALLMGRNEEILPRLMMLRSRAPLRETLAKYLMVALYLSGRSWEALGLYAELREEMTASLGVEPGPYLRDVHLGILRQSEPQALLESVVHPHSTVKLLRMKPS